MVGSRQYLELLSIRAAAGGTLTTAIGRLATGAAANRPNRWNRDTSVCSEISTARHLCRPG
jgi:hypothetical protein